MAASFCPVPLSTVHVVAAHCKLPFALHPGLATTWRDMWPLHFHVTNQVILFHWLESFPFIDSSHLLFFTYVIPFCWLESSFYWLKWTYFIESSHSILLTQNILFYWLESSFPLTWVILFYWLESFPFIDSSHSIYWLKKSYFINSSHFISLTWVIFPINSSHLSHWLESSYFIDWSQSLLLIWVIPIYWLESFPFIDSSHYLSLTPIVFSIDLGHLILRQLESFHFMTRIIPFYWQVILFHSFMSIPFIDSSHSILLTRAISSIDLSQ